MFSKVDLNDPPNHELELAPEKKGTVVFGATTAKHDCSKHQSGKSPHPRKQGIDKLVKVILVKLASRCLPCRSSTPKSEHQPSQMSELPQGPWRNI